MIHDLDKTLKALLAQEISDLADDNVRFEAQLRRQRREAERQPGERRPRRRAKAPKRVQEAHVGT